MKYLSALLCLSVVAIVAADFGHYVPKGFYTIDEEGNQSPMYFIESIPELFHRSRRQVNPGFQFPAFPFNSGFPQNFGFVPFGANNVNLNNRFGDTGTGTAGTAGTGNFGFGPNGAFPGFPFPNFPQPGQGNFQGTSITSVVNSKPGAGGINNRFGEENEQTIVTTVNKDGNVHETITHVRPDGSQWTEHKRRGQGQGQTQGNRQGTQQSTSTSG